MILKKLTIKKIQNEKFVSVESIKFVLKEIEKQVAFENKKYGGSIPGVSLILEGALGELG
jgi:hypothetical protein